jgi:hypothetical protein
MVEPVTVNKALIIPNTGDLSGTWGSAGLNPDLVALDGMLGGFAIISLTNANVLLTVPAGFTATPSAGPTQAQNALITFTGTLTGNCVITLPMPGYYIVENLCAVGAYYVALASVAPGKIICVPPGEAAHVFCNGVDVKYVGLGRVGSYLDLATSTVPSWITACTVPPYLNCDGSGFSGTTYPALAVYLGGTTLPDTRGRTRMALNQGTGRVQAGVSLLDGDTLLSGGGDQAMQQHNHTAVSVIMPGSVTVPSIGGANVQGGSNPIGTTNGTTSAAVSGSSVATTIANTGSGISQNVQPTYVGGLVLIRAA